MFALLAIATTAGAQGGVAINSTNFPDANFRSYVSANTIDKDKDGYLSDAEISAVTEIGVNHKKIANLKGIEFFTELTSLNCGDNYLASFNLAKNTKLTKLECYFNQLTSLDVSNNTALRYLDCSGNKLTSLDLSQNTALVELFCTNCQLNSLDLSQNTALVGLLCGFNQLESLDLSMNTALTVFYCLVNQIKSDKMQALVNSLPTVEGEEKGKFYVINTKDENEKNVITKSQVAIAKGKNWTVYDCDFYNGNWDEYAGSDDPMGIGGVEADALDKAAWYTLDGKKLSGEPTKKGVYIYKGRKVVK